jgi:hypothetical protein
MSSCEMLTYIQQFTRRYIQEDRTLVPNLLISTAMLVFSGNVVTFYFKTRYHMRQFLCLVLENMQLRL